MAIRPLRPADNPHPTQHPLFSLSSTGVSGSVLLSRFRAYKNRVALFLCGMERETRLELATTCLEGRHSTN